MPRKINPLALNFTDTKEALDIVVRTKRTAYIKGSPGVGKSALVRAIADDYNLFLLDVRLASCDPTDLNGFPSIDEDINKASYVPFDSFPLSTDPIPQGYNGWLVFLDEVNGAERAVQKASYKIALDRKVGHHDLHPNVIIICAGNLDTDNALTEEMGSAMKSRLVHLHLMSDHKVFIDHAPTAGFDHRVTSFIAFKPDMLNNFDPSFDEADTFACDRTWEFASDIVQQMTDAQLNSRIALPLLAGTIGEGAAREFLSFVKCYKDLPTIDQIIAGPNSVPIPEQESTLYAVSGSIAANAAPDNIAKLMQFTQRLPKEYQVRTLRDMVRRNRKLTLETSVSKWVTENGQELF